MDGNGRWAAQRGKQRLEGHRAGTENIRRVLGALQREGIKYVTLYAFSTENWGRPDSEVKGLLGILGSVIKQEVGALHQQNIRIHHLGALERIPSSLASAIKAAVKLTKRNNGLELCVAFDYGGRAELVRAMRNIAQALIRPEDINEETIRQALYLPDIPDPDLIIRTAGEHRLSNFLLWQAAYSEYYQTSVLWPDFGDSEIRIALDEYARRQRRFGRLPDA